MDLTYSEVGATRPDAGPVRVTGYRTTRRRQAVGHGGPTFTRAAAALRSWQMYRTAGLAVRASSPTVEPGATVATGFGVGPVRLWAPCRVVWVVDEPTRFGYGYGTLPGHPVSGEESFMLTLDADGTVWFEVASFSCPARWYTRIAGPLGRLGQDLATGRYLAAMRDLARAPGQ
ncbi:MAG TPA: DUF1990 domain-containing protein [Micromonosporaceae bacterium]